MNPIKAKVKHVLNFLQQGFDKGLATNTLKRQVAAISGILGSGSGSNMASHPHVKRFLRGVAQLNVLYNVCCVMCVMCGGWFTGS